MKYFRQDSNAALDLLDYQTHRFQGLIAEIVNCCRDHTSYISRRFDIPEAEVRCLMLFGVEKYLTPKGIAEKLEVSKSRATKLIDGLKQKRLVECVTDSKDARVKLISLTQEGKKKREEIHDIGRKLHAEVLSELEPQQRKMALSSLELLRSSMEAVKEKLV